jgi:hypothetical protein
MNFALTKLGGSRSGKGLKQSDRPAPMDTELKWSLKVEMEVQLGSAGGSEKPMIRRFPSGSAS